VVYCTCMNITIGIHAWTIIAVVLYMIMVHATYAMQNQVVANEVVANVPPTVTIAPDASLQRTCGASCTSPRYRLVRQLNCGALVPIGIHEGGGENGVYNGTNDASHNANLRQTLPSCVLIPRVTLSGAVMLEWVTRRATVAFIDVGVGHVNPRGGARIVTPTHDTTYNMTVLDGNGRVGVWVCGVCGMYS